MQDFNQDMQALGFHSTSLWAWLDRESTSRAESWAAFVWQELHFL